LEKTFAAAGISLRAESEVKLTVCIAVPPEMACIGHVVEITMGGEVAMIGIGTGRQWRACFQGMDIRKAQVSEGDKSTMWIPGAKRVNRSYVGIRARQRQSRQILLTAVRDNCEVPNAGRGLW
jgi:hypothetical protein